MASKTLTRANLGEAVSKEANLTAVEAAAVVDATFEEISKVLEKDILVKISSFGTFMVRQKKQRIGRNPKTKVEVPIKPRKVISFKASTLLKSKINS